MLIEYRGIIAERTEDCPDGEYGALVVAKDCHRNCKGCFNQHLRGAEVLIDTEQHIVDVICSNPLHQWCIFGGLEWSEDPTGLEALATEALRRGLKVIIYTGCDPFEFQEKLGKETICKLKGCYVKFGSYDETKLDNAGVSFGVKMASSNQFISML